LLARSAARRGARRRGAKSPAATHAFLLPALTCRAPQVSAELVEKVFASVTRTNPDGKMSVRDLRQ